jgi:hypothetical protein
MANRPLTVGYVVNTPLNHNSSVTSPNLPFDELGTPREELDDDLGYRKFIFVQNTGGSNIAAGDCLIFLDDVKQNVGPYAAGIAAGFSVGASLNRVAGVAIGAINAGNYGWIQTQGLHPAVKTNGAVANGQALTLDNTASSKAAAVALGTAPPYAVLGTAVGPAASNLTPVQLSIV